ncbi:MAG: SUMF1/EgtB/PvdO family nonheme iron enzyme [Deltaproteobacteria bacterium]|nr:SUMF1/EgtB/PvdO family nonheme iron enzyme [Deltaproteobacteria bacterium]
MFNKKNYRLAVAALVGALLAAPMLLRATGPCPDGMARVDEQYCIDRYEASLVQQLDSGTEQAWSPFHAPEHTQVRAVSRRGVTPQGYISADQAARACTAAGKRLCSDREWVRACSGPRRTQYTYGNQRVAGACNEDHTRHPVVYLFARTHRHLWNGVLMNDPQLNQVPGTLASSGQHEQCTNDYGVFDMQGNLHEWTSDPEGTFRGGYFMDNRINGDGCQYVTRGHNRTYHDYSTGFRCCANLPD